MFEKTLHFVTSFHIKQKTKHDLRRINYLQMAHVDNVTLRISKQKSMRIYRRENDTMSKRLRQAHYKLIEDELRYYHSTKKEMLEKRANIVMGSMHQEFRDENQGGSASGQISNEVEQRVMLLQMDREIQRMSNTVRAIDTVLSTLSDEDKQLVHFRYWDRSRPTWTWIACKLNISESTAKRKRKEIIYKIAERLGY